MCFQKTRRPAVCPVIQSNVATLSDACNVTGYGLEGVNTVVKLHRRSLAQHALVCQAMPLWNGFSILPATSLLILTFHLFRLPPTTPKRQLLLIPSFRPELPKLFICRPYETVDPARKDNTVKKDNNACKYHLQDSKAVVRLLHVSLPVPLFDKM